MYSVRDLLIHVKNPQTKLKIFGYLKQKNALDSSVGLVYRRDTFEIVYIY